jgi:hypothetical protein
MLALVAAGCSGPASENSPASAAPAAAHDLSVRCEQELASGKAETTLAYSGGKSGTLTTTGAFGAMELPATWTVQKSDVDDENVIGIEARGAANVITPDRASLENCLRENGADPGDANVVAYQLAVCQHQVPQGAAPEEIDVSITIAIIDAPSAEVFITRTFKEESAAAGGRMQIDSFPPLTCKIVGDL